MDNLLAWVRDLLQHVAAPIVVFYADERRPRDAAQEALRARLAQMRPAALHLTLVHQRTVQLRVVQRLG